MRKVTWTAGFVAAALLLALMVGVLWTPASADGPAPASVDASALDLDHPDVIAFYAARAREASKVDAPNAEWCWCVKYIQNRYGLSRSAHAKDMGPILRAAGFRQVSEPRPGAVIIFQPAFRPGGDGNTYGHIGVVETARSVNSNRDWSVSVRGANQSGSIFTQYNCNNVSVVGFRAYPKSTTSVSYWVR